MKICKPFPQTHRMTRRDGATAKGDSVGDAETKKGQAHGLP